MKKSFSPRIRLKKTTNKSLSYKGGFEFLGRYILEKAKEKYEKQKKEKI